MVCPNKQSSNEQPSLETRDVYFSHPSECHLYITCDSQGNMSILKCFNGTHFSPYYQSCVHPSVVNCKKYPMVKAQTIYSLKNHLEAKLKLGSIDKTSEILASKKSLEKKKFIQLNNNNNTSYLESNNSTNSTFF